MQAEFIPRLYPEPAVRSSGRRSADCAPRRRGGSLGLSFPEIKYLISRRTSAALSDIIEGAKPWSELQ